MSSRVQAGSLRRRDAGQNVTVAGWVRKQRDFGELIFIDLRDRSGLLQLVLDQARSSPELMQMARDIRSEFVLRVTGLVVEREAERRNPELPSGEIELLVQQMEVLSRSDTPPFVVEEDTSASEETRLEYRYLDLRRPNLTRNMILRDAVCRQVRSVLQKTGFLEIETPILTASTPEGARDYLVPSRVHPGEFYALPQSPQLFKQLLMVSGLERYYQIARCFRDEDIRSDRQPEFTQIDIEASFVDEEFLFDLIEKMFVAVFPEAGIHPATPFPRLTWRDAIDRFGTDRPDLRYAMEIVDATELASKISFPPFAEAAGNDEVVRGIVVPRGSGLSRKRLDALTEEAKSLGAGGLVWVKLGTEPSSSIRKFLEAADYQRLREHFSAGSDDLLLMIVGPWEKASSILGDLRIRIAGEEGMIPEHQWKFVWIVDFPLFEFNAEDSRWYARHHPFTSPKPEHEESIESDPGSAIARAYDIVLNGLELGGGSIRIHRPEMQRKMFRALGIEDAEAEEKFGFLMEAFRYGAPPHGGIALGLDRIVMLMAGASSIRDVIAFPKTARGQDLMAGAPSPVAEKHLRELSISLKKKK